MDHFPKLHSRVIATTAKPRSARIPPAITRHGILRLRSPCQNLDFPEGRNLGGFGRTLSEREDLIAEVS